MKLFLALAPLAGLLALEPAPTSSAAPAAVLRDVSIDDAAWLAGRWEGELFGGFAEEQWSLPADGAMMGMFRHVQGDRVGFYEFFLLKEDEEHGLVLRLKHFHPDLVGWEEKGDFVEFPLIEASENELIFDGIRFQLTEPDVISGALSLAQNGKVETVEFEYRRVPEGA